MTRRTALGAALAAVVLAVMAACSSGSDATPEATAAATSAPTLAADFTNCPTGVHELANPGDLGNPCYFVSGALMAHEGEDLPSNVVLQARWIGGPQPAQTLVNATFDASGNFTLIISPGARYILELPARSTKTVTTAQAGGGQTVQSALIIASTNSRSYYTLSVPADQTLPGVLGSAVSYGLSVNVAPPPTLIPNALQMGVNQGIGVKYDPAHINRLRVQANQAAAGTGLSLFELAYLIIGVCGAALFALFASRLSRLLVDPRYRSGGNTTRR